MNKTTDDEKELLRTLLIVQLGLAGVPREDIRAIAKCNNNHVSSILQRLSKARKRGNTQ